MEHYFALNRRAPATGSVAAAGPAPANEPAPAMRGIGDRVPLAARMAPRRYGRTDD